MDTEGSLAGAAAHAQADTNFCESHLFSCMYLWTFDQMFLCKNAAHWSGQETVLSDHHAFIFHVYVTACYHVM